MKVRSGIKFAALSDVGSLRETNEDSFGYWEAAGDEEFRRKGRLAIIADGMGGHEGGQEASRIAVDTVQRVYAGANGTATQESLLESLKAAHRLILQYAAENPPLQGMGTTCTAIVLCRDQLFYAHIGDSRLYLVRHGQISCITHDHSYVNRLVQAGVIRPDQAESHPQRNVLMAALGAGAEVDPESPENPIAIERGDLLLLCTDGLWGLVSDKEIQAVTASGAPDGMCRKLVQLANERGGPDNITVMVIRISA